MEARIGLLGALIGAYVTAHYARKSDRRVQLAAFAGFLEGISGCLERMADSLRKDTVPTADGNALEKMVEDFASTVQKAPLDTAWKEKAESVRSQLQVHLHSGEIIDDIIRGKMLSGPPELKERMLHAMVATSGILRGQAHAIRAQAE